MITVSFDITQLDRTKFKKVTRRNGIEAVFCELVLWETPDNEFGDFLVKQSRSRDEQEKQISCPIIGNAKHKPKPPEIKSALHPATPDDIPF